MTIRTNPQPAKQAAAKAFNAYNLAAFTIGAKVSTTINVAVQLQDARGQSISQIARGKMYLSDSNDGHTLTATATTSALAVATNGVILATPVSGKLVDFITNASGQIDFNVIQTASPVTYYMVLVMPDGSIVVSGAVTF